jgi:hypothetical protein
MDGTRTVDYFGYAGCIALENGETRVVLGPHCGGRVLEYAWRGENALYLDPAQAGWTYAPPAAGAPGVAAGTPRDPAARPPNPTGGRCDIGPEHIIPRHPTLWLGSWTAEVVGPRHARMTSADDPATGTRLVRDLVLDAATSRLAFTQTMVNVSGGLTQWCHWSRTFARHGGIAVVPLTPGSRFPRGYVMYGPGPVINFRPEDPSIVHRSASGTGGGDFLVIRGVPQYPKLGFDSFAGWFGYLLPSNLFFVKRFPCFPDRVYNEIAGLTSCIYYPHERVCELEPIGPRETLAPGESAAFAEEWHLLPYPFPADGQEIDLDDLARRLASAG